MIFLNIMLIGSSNDVFPWKCFENTHLAMQRGMSSVDGPESWDFMMTGCGAVW
jgi:uncharacterized protein YaeQ